MRGLWRMSFLSCEGLDEKSLANHLFRDVSRVEEDVHGQ